MITLFIPGAAVGKGRPRFARRGKHIATYTPEKTAQYETRVQHAARNAMLGAQPHEMALRATIVVSAEPPKSWSKKKRAAAICGELRPTTKPDVDNTAKGILDALNGIVYADDKQVVELHVVVTVGVTKPGAIAHC